MSKNLAIKINKLFKSYDDVKAVQGIDLEINKGEFYGLLGPNGAGKSTTINSITSLVKPSDGDIEIFGKNIENDFRFARSQVGIAQQEVSTDWFFPLEQLLYFQAGFYGVSRSHAKERIEYLLEKLGLSKHRTKKMRELSGGMKRRLQIAKALVHDPEIIILDEPTVGLDPIQIREIRKLIKEIGKNHSVILSTHILPEVEMVCDRVQIINQGSLVFHGSIDELKQQRIGNKLQVGLSKAPTLKELSSIDFINKVEKIENNLYRFHFKKIVDAEKLAALCFKNKWGLYHIAPDVTSLEDIFAQLTMLGN